MRALALLGPLALAGCVEAVPPAAPPAEPDRCQAASFQGLVGQSRAVLASLMLPAGSRVIDHGDAITADYSPGRLNVELDASGRISRIACY